MLGMPEVDRRPRGLQPPQRNRLGAWNEIQRQTTDKSDLIVSSVCSRAAGAPEGTGSGVRRHRIRCEGRRRPILLRVSETARSG